MIEIGYNESTYEGSGHNEKRSSCFKNDALFSKSITGVRLRGPVFLYLITII